MTQEETLFRVYVDEKGDLKWECPNSDDAVMAITDMIWHGIATKDQRLLDILFAVQVHTLARDLSGKMQAQYHENIDEFVRKYRDAYKQMHRELKPKMS